MTFRMSNLEPLILAEWRNSWRATRGVEIGGTDDSAYTPIEHVLRAQAYQRLGKKAKGTVRRFLAKFTGLGRAQITPLIAPLQACSGPATRQNNEKCAQAD